MGRTFVQILGQVERKRKYFWSCGTTRIAGASILAKLVTLLLFLCLVYFVTCGVLLSRSEGVDYSDGSEFPPKTTNSVGNHRSEFMKADDDYGELRTVNSSRSNMLNGINTNSVVIGTLKPSQAGRLAVIFHKADLNGDKFLSKKELAGWINNAIKIHFTRTAKDNFDKYFLIDSNPRNGLVSWEEYLEYFFRNHNIHGLSADDIRNMTPVFRSLPRDVKVEIARMQASWSESAINNPDYLTVDEFLAFEHPEVSPTKILNQVQDVFSTFDLDGDGTISEKEFETTYKEAEGVDRVYQNDKRIIDTDGNGQIGRLELMMYMDPRNFHHSVKDAEQLLKIADTDKDGRLNFQEVLKHRGNFIKSKFYNVEKYLNNQD